MSPAVDPSNVTATDLAANALLGALLWDPSRAADVTWLQAEDFAHPANRAIYATLTGMQAEKQQVDARTIIEPLRRGTYHDAVAVGGTSPGALLHDLLSGTPATPSAESMGQAPGTWPERSEHIRYARLVLDDSIRRQVVASGARIGQSTRDAATVDAEAASQHVNVVFEQISDRLQSLTERHAAAQSGNQLHGTAVRVERTTGERGAGAPRAELTPQETRRAELRLIGACLGDPGIRETAHRQLRRSDFADPAAGATWEAITGLLGRGEPVDFVLVAAELERSGCAGLPAHQLLQTAQKAVAPAALRDLDTVARASIARAGDQVQQQLAALAADRGRGSTEVLKRASQTVGEASETAIRVAGGAPATTAARVFQGTLSPDGARRGTPAGSSEPARDSGPPRPTPAARVFPQSRR